MNDIFTFYQKYIELEAIARKGWQMLEVPEKRYESDSDHTLQSLLLANLIIRQKNLDLDYTKVMDTLLIHEIGEILIGDIAIVEENYAELKAGEEEAVVKLLKDLDEDIQKYYHQLWYEFNYKLTKEGEFCYFIDRIDAVLKALYYSKKYQKDYFTEFNYNSKNCLKDNSYLYLYEEIIESCLKNERL